MEQLMNRPEMMEQAEQTMSAEQLDQMSEMYRENMEEAQRAGNGDMAQYYQKKLEALEAQALATDDSRMGGWYAGYTPAEWRRMADEEYRRNGNTIEYRHLMSNAQKAEG